MGNANYIAGRKLEYEVMEYFRKWDYQCFRTAGSHSPVDVIAMSTLNVILIQCKRYKKSKPKPEQSFIDLPIYHDAHKMWITKKCGQKNFEMELI